MERLSFCAALVVGAMTFAGPRAAEACGGYFIAANSGAQEANVVTGHRMALAISQDETVLWDQIEYAGAPEEFSWVLPVKAGAVVEVALDAWFDALDAGTRAVIGEPTVTCPTAPPNFGSSSGCARDEAARGPGERSIEPAKPASVEVVSRGTAGPYETVTLSTTVPDALVTWLDDNGFDAPADIIPVIDQYVAEGFDFIAMKLRPGQGVNAMKPVRVRVPGASFALPLRMVAAGTGAQTAITLFVIGEGRYGVKGFNSATIDSDELTWDFDDNTSNYDELRLDAMAEVDGRTWLTAYARRATLLTSLRDPLDPESAVTYDVADGEQWDTIADAYFAQARFSGEIPRDAACDFPVQSSTNIRVVASATDLGPGDVSHEAYICDRADDVGVALIGKHLRDVWITRLEANLPREALSRDLEVTAHGGEEVNHRRPATRWINSEWCADQLTPARIGPSGERSGELPRSIMLLLLSGLGLAWCARRRMRTPMR